MKKDNIMAKKRKIETPAVVETPKPEVKTEEKKRGRKAEDKCTIKIGDMEYVAEFEFETPVEDWKQETLVSVARSGYMNKIRSIMTAYYSKYAPGMESWKSTMENLLEVKNTFGIADDDPRYLKLLNPAIAKFRDAYGFSPDEELKTNFVISESEIME